MKPSHPWILLILIGDIAIPKMPIERILSTLRAIMFLLNIGPFKAPETRNPSLFPSNSINASIGRVLWSILHRKFAQCPAAFASGTFGFEKSVLSCRGPANPQAGVDEFQTCQFCQEPRLRWSSMCAYIRLTPPIPSHASANSWQTRRIKDAFHTPDLEMRQQVLSHAMIVPWPRSDSESRPQRHTISLPFLSSCCIVLPCPEFRSGPSASSITKRFDLVCVRDRKVSVLRDKNAFYTRKIFAKNDSFWLVTISVCCESVTVLLLLSSYCRIIC